MTPQLIIKNLTAKHETPRETVVAELKEIAKLDFEGVSAEAYFDTFHTHFETDLAD